MKKFFYLMSLMLALVVSGMIITSCGDDDEDSGLDSNVFAMTKGYWERDNNPIDKYGYHEWIPYWEITANNLFCRNEDHSVGEKYVIDKFNKNTNTIVCTYIDLEDGTEGYKSYIKVVSVTQEKLSVRYYEEGEEDDYETATFTRVR